MKLTGKIIKVEDCITISAFVKEIREKTGINSISRNTIDYHLKNTDTLDFIEWCGTKMIVKNDKYVKFSPGKYYSNSGAVRRAKKKLKS